MPISRLLLLGNIRWSVSPLPPEVLWWWMTVSHQMSWLSWYIGARLVLQEHLFVSRQYVFGILQRGLHTFSLGGRLDSGQPPENNKAYTKLQSVIWCQQISTVYQWRNCESTCNSRFVNQSDLCSELYMACPYLCIYALDGLIHWLPYFKALHKHGRLSRPFPECDQQVSCAQWCLRSLHCSMGLSRCYKLHVTYRTLWGHPTSDTTHFASRQTNTCGSNDTVDRSLCCTPGSPTASPGTAPRTGPGGLALHGSWSEFLETAQLDYIKWYK